MKWVHWMFEKDFSAGQFERVYPDSSCELICMRRGEYSVDGVTLPPCFMVGQLEQPVDFVADGPVAFWAVRFYPWGLQEFDMRHQLAGKSWLPADAIMPPEIIAALMAVISLAGTEKDIVTALDGFFLEKLTIRQKDNIADKISYKLLAERGNICVRDLADHCCMSQRQLERRMLSLTGKTPKQIADRLRFELARDTIMHRPNMPLSYLARDCGYSDQSHLVKEFKRYMGITPSRYSNFFRRVSPQMQNKENVVFLQDAS